MLTDLEGSFHDIVCIFTLFEKYIAMESDWIDSDTEERRKSCYRFAIKGCLTRHK